ncbi:MAG TPA: hypothetical protein PLD20_27570 [Blastocatellia bacterium]|nr:hypothetical protein [Blastocatellia bacterium]HMV84756.1 hypothetical protein [Blastocatellia bacterium]HMX29938.1 hypothetical protein [Blastocatellia bacterium]HMY70232.1 hypothetical protein [Blastocatellia bacterium]HMZ21722.1 hypothetical protein [Blastocatellia bacterium]
MVKQLFAFLLLFALAPFVLAEDYKVETIGALTETKVAEAVRKAVEEKGLRVVDGKGKAVCEIWFRKDIPTGKDDVPGAIFSQILEGTFIGVINFPANTNDFRGQGVKAGWYTLRSALILQDGNHLGVSPARDFFLICPAADDKDPNATMKMEELLKLSRAAIGAGHPSPWFFQAATSAEKDLPKIVKNEHEHVILETKLTTKSGPLAIGLIVIGRTEG